MSRTSHLTLRLATPAKATANEDEKPLKAVVARRHLSKLQTIARELYEYELYREATDLFRYLTMVDPTNPTHWYWLGRALVSVGDPLNAAHVFEMGGRLSHISHFSQLAADAWHRAGFPERAEAAINLTAGAS